MTDIRRYPFLRHVRGSATSHIEHIRRGRLVHSGTGLSFWFRPLDAVLSEIPVDDRELPVLVHARTSDFQDVAIQATTTYRFTDPATAAQRIDFSVDPDHGQWRAAPLDQIGSLMAETLQQHALRLVAGMSLEEAVTHGHDAVRATVMAAMAQDERLAQTGISVIGVRVVAIRPEPDVEKALQTPVRERLQQEADRATYERRALAVERERAISENELQNQIELARREEQLVAQRGTNARRQAEDEGAATRIRTQAEADATRTLGGAEAAAEAARLDAYRDLPVDVLWSLAARELASGLPQVQSLVLTPELLSPLLARLGASPAERS